MDGLHATTIAIAGPRGCAIDAVAAALPQLVLVDIDGQEQDPVSILTAPAHAEMTTAARVIDTSLATSGGGSVVVIHRGPATVARAQGYIDVLSDLCDPGDDLTIRVEFDGETMESPVKTIDRVRRRKLVRWAREGLDARPDSHRYSALALLPMPTPDLAFPSVVLEPKEELLARGLTTPARYSHHGLHFAEFLAARSMTAPPSHVRGQKHLHGADGKIFAEATLETNNYLKPARLWQTSTRVRPPTEFRAPDDFGGGTWVKPAPDGAPVARKRKGTEGRMVYLDASTLAAEIDREWFHPDDIPFTCVASAFNAAGSVSLFMESDGVEVERKYHAAKSHGHLTPIPLDDALIYSYGALVLTLREKKKQLHPDTTRFELMAALVAHRYNAVLATCFPERYKGVLRGLEIAHYRPTPSSSLR